MKLLALNDNVIVEPILKEAESESGILLDDASDFLQRGKVVSAVEIEEGETVLYHKQGTFPIPGTDYTVVQKKNIVSLVKE